MSPYFSVIIPTYNRANFIEKTIESVLNQTYQNFEIIVVDDGSTDNTLGVLEQYKNNNKIHVHHQKNAERGAARNKGISLAKGEYVIFLDSDDLFLEHYLELLFKKIKQNNNPNFIATNYNIRVVGKNKRIPDFDALKEGFYDYKLLLKGNVLGCLYCCRLANTNLKLFQEDRAYSIMEDWLFALENLLYDKILIVPEVSRIIIDHDGRSMRTNHNNIINARLRANNWALTNLPLENYDKRTLNYWTYYFCSVHYNLDGQSRLAFKYYLKLLNVFPFKRVTVIHFARLLLGIFKYSKV